jgi:histidyl-tRNA synthetase
MEISAPRGTKDILPDSSGHWQYVEGTARAVCRDFGYYEIRTPVFEHTELFLRGIGETTDIVQKEMYTFADKGGRSITLRPENTAGVVRAYVEHKLYGESQQPAKMFYIGPMFRYDKPQAGRFRQFHQFGIEAVGSAGPAVDAEVIHAAMEFFRRLGLKDLNLFINSVGCPVCRPVYRARLQDALRDKLGEFCDDCRSRFDRNPMRILDCKNEKCNMLSKDAPQMGDCLCDECRDHFAGLQTMLSAAGLGSASTRGWCAASTITPRPLSRSSILRSAPRAPSAAAAATTALSRRSAAIRRRPSATPSAWNGSLLALDKQGLLSPVSREIDVFVAAVDDKTRALAFKLACELRMAGLVCDMDYMNRSLKAQLRQANRYPARFVAIIGEDEAALNKVALKNMQTGEQQLVDAGQVKEAVQAAVGGR